MFLFLYIKNFQLIIKFLLPILFRAEEFVATIEKRTGIMIGCIEEIAYRSGWIDREALIKLAKSLIKTEYGKYLLKLIEE
jgi:glucose-1-phosphate thymidylyltransferase